MLSCSRPVKNNQLLGSAGGLYGCSMGGAVGVLLVASGNDQSIHIGTGAGQACWESLS